MGGEDEEGEMTRKRCTKENPMPKDAELERLREELRIANFDTNVCIPELQEELTRLRALESRLTEEGVAPGVLIANVTCPSCGSGLKIEHGDDEGEVVTICGTRESINVQKP